MSEEDRRSDGLGVNSSSARSLFSDLLLLLSGFVLPLSVAEAVFSEIQNEFDLRGDFSDGDAAASLVSTLLFCTLELTILALVRGSTTFLWRTTAAGKEVHLLQRFEVHLVQHL